MPPTGYMREAFTHVRSAGGVCIVDEVQIGFGRMGAHMWGFQTQDVVPDIVTLGKPIGNGHPMAAVITTRDIAEEFDNGLDSGSRQGFDSGHVTSAHGAEMWSGVSVQNHGRAP